MKTLYEFETIRHGVTPSQFLAYCRAMCKKRGISWDMDSRYFAEGEKRYYGYLDLHYNGGTPSTRPAVSEICKALPYSHQTYIMSFDGSVYNEIVEFTFDNERTGTGYLYIVSTESDSAADAAETAASVARYHERQAEKKARQIEKKRADITETEKRVSHGWINTEWADSHVGILRVEIDILEDEIRAHRAAVAEMTAETTTETMTEEA